MERSIPEIIGLLAVGVMALLIVGFLGFAFTFGAADHTRVTFQAERLSAAEVVDDITYDPSSDAEPIVDRTIETGHTRTVALSYEPFFEDAPPHRVYGEGAAQSVYVEQNGTFYRIAFSNTTDVGAERPTLELVPVNETEGDFIGFEDLPTVDRRLVREAHAYRMRGCDTESRSDRVPPCGRPYSSRATNASILVPTPPADYVRYQNQTFELIVRERMVDAVAISYRAKPVADDSEAFRTRFVTAIDADVLTNGELELLEQAMDEGYSIEVYRHDLEQVPRERFNSLLPTLGLPTLDRLSQGHHGSAVGYIDYRGGFYRVQIEYADTYA